MTTLDEIRCDGLECHATTTADLIEWYSVTIVERTTDAAYVRHADLCPVHAQALLDVCGPIPRRA